MLWVESPRRGDSYEYPQHTFLWRTDKKYSLIITKYPPYLFYYLTFQVFLLFFLVPEEICDLWLWHSLEIIRIFHGCEVRIEKSVRGSLFGITMFCWVMLNSDLEGPIFLSAPNNHDRFFFLHTFWPQAFNFNLGVAIDKSFSFMLMSAILKWRQAQRLNDRVTWPPIQAMYWHHVLLFFFI